MSTAGPYISKFEKSLSKFCNASYSVAVTNGTVALRLSLHIVGVKNDDEVITTPMSFVATPNAISHLGAYPHFIDIDRDSLGMCPISLDKNSMKLVNSKMED